MNAERFLYFISGLGIGVAVACLSAPKSGNETRKMLRNSASEGRHFVSRQADEAKKRITDTIGRGKHAATTIAEEMKEAVEDGRAALGG